MKCALTCLVLRAVLSARSFPFKPQGRVMVAIGENGETEAQSDHAVCKRICCREVTERDLNPSSWIRACASTRCASPTSMQNRRDIPGNCVKKQPWNEGVALKALIWEHRGRWHVWFVSR